MSDGNNNNNERTARNISTIFNGLNINDNGLSTSEQPNESINKNVQNSEETLQENLEENLEETLVENLDDSVILVEPKIEVIELLEDSFEDTSTSMHFSMLSTDDPTDEEDETPKNVNLRIAWSDRENVKSLVVQQEHISDKVVDAFFGSDGMSVNLYDIFPNIEPELTVRRRSSVQWNTPPRHSMLPKY